MGPCRGWSSNKETEPLPRPWLALSGRRMVLRGPVCPSSPVSARPIYTKTTLVWFSTANTQSTSHSRRTKTNNPLQASYGHELDMAASVACAFFFDAEPVGEPGVHALDACALCTKPLARDSDIFMYRGDTPYCSEECRHEQTQLDAACARQAARAAARRQKQFSSGTESGRARRESWEVSVTS
ncbi:uncharacterized protein [Aegilops tauschii subsp. strangulata]|nr:FCS-Like Zinc finger 2 [Aegilops tauschii subsp. strangulata]